MIDFLLGVPGKLTTIASYLATYLDPARAAKIDYLDASVSTRAAAATAVSNATWTDELSAQLDRISKKPLNQRYYAIVVPMPVAKKYAPTSGQFEASSSTSAGSFTNIVTYTGSGECLYLNLTTNAQTTGEQAQFEIYIDGTLLTTITVAYSGSGSGMECLVFGNYLGNYWNGTTEYSCFGVGAGITAKFTTSIQVKGRASSGSLSCSAEMLLHKHS